MSHPEEAEAITPPAAAGYRGWAPAEVRDDVIEIAIRADDLGFCRRRVASALEATRCEMAVIEDHIDSRGVARGRGL